jgi:hypothetical protein
LVASAQIETPTVGALPVTTPAESTEAFVESALLQRSEDGETAALLLVSVAVMWSVCPT